MMRSYREMQLRQLTILALLLSLPVSLGVLDALDDRTAIGVAREEPAIWHAAIDAIRWPTVVISYSSENVTRAFVLGDLIAELDGVVASATE